MTMKRQNMTEIWLPKNGLHLVELNEAEKKEVDGTYIIGKVRGDFYVPDGESRNSRFYPRSFWEAVLKKEDVQTRLKDRLMFGMLGHEDKEIDEKDLEAGRASHIVTNLYIDENNNGIGEALILGTEAGKNLLVYLKAGAQLRVSSRASGDYKQGEQHNNMPVMDESSYILETFDFVIDPGFLKARPSLVEKNLYGGVDMPTISEELVLELKNSRDSLMKDLSCARGTIESLKKENETLKDAIPFTDKGFIEQVTKLGISSPLIESLSSTAQNMGLPFEDFVKKMAGFKKEEMLAIEKMSENLPRAYTDLTAYRALEASPREIKRTMERAERALEEYTKIGTAEELKKVIEDSEKVLESYLKYGSLEDLREQKKLLASTIKTLEAYQSFGTLEEVKTALKNLTDIQASEADGKLQEAASRLSRKYKVKLEKCRRLIRRLGEEDAEDTLQDAEKEPTDNEPDDIDTDVNTDIDTGDVEDEPDTGDTQVERHSSRRKKSNFLESRLGRTKKINQKNS